MCESLTGKRNNDSNLGRLEDSEITLFNGVFTQGGILPLILSGTPDLRQHLISFFVGDKSILIVGGESGMGKSLITTDIRRLHEDINAKLPSQLRVPLVVVSWDRTHAALFEAASVETGSTIPLPKGETNIRGRRVVSHVIGDVVRYAKKYIHPNSKIIIETPLIDIRGETLYEELSDMRGQIQTLIMHSPESREQTLTEGRLMHTSGQPDSMNQIREKLLQGIMGRNYVSLSQEARDDVVYRWWEGRLAYLNGIIVRWSPDVDRHRYEHTIAAFRAERLKPDILAPRSVSRFVRRQYESIFDTFLDIDAFLRTLDSE